MLQHDDGRFTVIPKHNPIDKGTLLGILSDVGLRVLKVIEIETSQFP